MKAPRCPFCRCKATWEGFCMVCKRQVLGCSLCGGMDVVFYSAGKAGYIRLCSSHTNGVYK